MNARLRSLLGAAGLATALASGTAFAQADNSNSLVAPAQPNAGMGYRSDGFHSPYHTPHHAMDPSMPGYRPVPDAAARERAWNAERGNPQSETNLQRNPANVDPVTGTITAPGYTGPKDVSK